MCCIWSAVATCNCPEFLTVERSWVMLSYLRCRVTLGPSFEKFFHPVVEHSMPVLWQGYRWSCGLLASLPGDKRGRGTWGMLCVGEVCTGFTCALSILWRKRMGHLLSLHGFCKVLWWYELPAVDQGQFLLSGVVLCFGLGISVVAESWLAVSENHCFILPMGL